MDGDAVKRALKRKRLLWGGGVTLVFLTLLIGWVLYWAFVLRFETKTEDAYVGGNIVAVTASTDASITAIYADRSDFVERGQPLLELDVASKYLALEEAEGALAHAVRRAVQLREKVVQAEEVLHLRQVEEAQAALDFSHRKNLQLSGALPQEEIEKAESHLASAVQRTRIACSELEEARARIEGTTPSTDPLVMEMKARYVNAYLETQHGTVTSPVRGYVAQREVHLGESVHDGQMVMTVVPLDEVWVTANFKETQIASLGIGQRVLLTSSAYGKGKKFYGEVRGAVPGTGVSFSLLPPQNATGNWIKIVQRVPVLIALEEPPTDETPLFLGLSMSATVDTKEKKEPLIPISSGVRSYTHNPPDDENIARGEERAQEIIRRNLYE